MVLWIHAVVMGFLALVGFAATDGFAELYEISETAVLWATAVCVAVAIVLAALAFLPSWRVALMIGGGINVVLGGTLLGLAPSAPTGRGVTLLVVIAVAFALIAMAEIGIRGARSGRTPTDT